MSQWFKSKTLWTAILATVGVVAAAVTGEMTWHQALPVIVTSIIGVFVRDAAVKSGSSEGVK